jgi:hypothetical protein
MRRLLLAILSCVALVPGVRAAEGRVIKVLPQFLDQHGQSTVSPSLYDRDAYQKYLRLHPAKQSGLRFAVQWKAKAPETEALQLKVEMRGMAHGNVPRQTTIQEEVHQRHKSSHWTDLKLTGDAWREFGEVTAWRVTLWDGKEMLGEQKSFLW